jgi:transcriptional regulator with XRE-family HTH domain
MKYPVGQRVRKARRDQDLTQRELATRAGMNIVTISRLEHGTSEQIYADTLGDLARALNVSADYLLGLSDTREVQAPGPAPARRSRTRKTVPVG